jgi:hypothetical protein
MVGLLRPFRKQKREYIPDGEIEYGANDEAVDREISLRNLLEMFAEMLVLD